MSSPVNAKDIQRDFDIFLQNMSDSLKKKVEETLISLSVAEKKYKSGFYGKSYIMTTKDSKGIYPFYMDRMNKCSTKIFHSSCLVNDQMILFVLEYEHDPNNIYPSILSIGVYL